MSVPSRYERRGVSFNKEEVHKAIKGLDKGLFPNAFCKVLPDMVGGDYDYCNIMHADTAGTKTSLAYLYWKETGDLNVWKGIAQDAIVMNIDDMACIGCTSGIVLSSTIGRNKTLITGEVISEIINATQQIVLDLNDAAIEIALAGGETADVGDIVRTIDVGYTTFARMKRSEVIENNIQPGDVVLGFASFGQATYEDEYNSGIGSNGLTSARHDVLSNYYKVHFPESFDPSIDQSVVYSGAKRLTDFVEIDGQTYNVGKLLLAPTRTYLPLLAKIVPTYRKQIHGIIHCSGGAQTKVGKFIDKVRVIKDQLFPTPPVFQLIQNESGTDWKEMYQVFNMGHRLEMYVPASVASELIEAAKVFNIEAKLLEE